MTDSEKQAKVTELLGKEESLAVSIDIVVSSYKETSEEKSLRATLANTADEVVIEAIENRLKAFVESDLDTDKLVGICGSHGFSLPEVVKNGLSKIRGGYMFRRKTLSKELTAKPAGTSDEKAFQAAVESSKKGGKK